MKNNKFSKYLLIALTLLAFNKALAQSTDSPVARIYNVSNPSDLSEFGKLNLDETHPDILDPSIARDDKEKVVASWIDLHQSIGNYLTENDFSWGIEAESISMYQRIYFNGDGQITNFLFNIRTPEVTEEKKAEFGKLLAKFTTEHKLSYTLPNKFAQCGKTRYAN